MREDQTSVNEWALNVFGPRTLAPVVERMTKEYSELVERYKASGAIDPGECADVLIMMYSVAQIAGFDLAAHVDLKMTINRHRKWHLFGDGTGQHIPE